MKIDFVIRKGLALLGLAIAVIGLSPATASADYVLSTGNVGLNGDPAPFGTVNVSLTNSTEAVITFTAGTTTVNGTTSYYLFGGAQAVDFNVNASSWTVKSMVGTDTGGNTNSPAQLSNGGTNNADGWGSFNQTIDNFDGAGHAFNVATITIDNTSGTWADAQSVLTGNSNGYLVAAHVFVYTDSTYTHNTDTGYATNGPVNPVNSVPAPPALLLALSGMGAIGGICLLRRLRPVTAPAAELV